MAERGNDQREKGLTSRKKRGGCSPGCKLMESPRRFPPPWTIDESNNACFIVRDVAI
jgi:hypothetical protein